METTFLGEMLTLPKKLTVYTIWKLQQFCGATKSAFPYFHGNTLELQNSYFLMALSDPTRLSVPDFVKICQETAEELGRKKASEAACLCLFSYLIWIVWKIQAVHIILVVLNTASRLITWIRHVDPLHENYKNKTATFRFSLEMAHSSFSKYSVSIFS